MKKYLVTLFSVTLYLVNSLYAGEVIYQVSKAGKDKARLLEVFNMVRDYELKINQPTEWRFTVFQKIDGQNFLVIYFDQKHWLKTLENYNFVDNESYKLYIEKSEETKSYTTVLGANSTVRVLEEYKPVTPVPMTQDEFVEKLKSAQVWTLRNAHRTNCDACFGGKLNSLKGGGTCRACNGSGEKVSDLVVKW